MPGICAKECKLIIILMTNSKVMKHMKWIRCTYSKFARQTFICIHHSSRAEMRLNKKFAGLLSSIISYFYHIKHGLHEKRRSITFSLFDLHHSKKLILFCLMSISFETVQLFLLMKWLFVFKEMHNTQLENNKIIINDMHP